MNCGFSRLSLLTACAVFLVFLVRPGYMVFLRHRLEARQPEHWARLPMNGSFQLLVPQIFGMEPHDEALYAARVRQVLLHGVPYNPYWRENRTAGYWLQDSIVFYILAGVGLACGKDLTLTWALMVAMLGAFWFLFFYAIFRWWSGTERVAIPLALFSVLFPDFYFFLLDINFSPAVNLLRYTSIFFQCDSRILPHAHRLPNPFLSLLLLSLLFLWNWRLIASSKDRPSASLLLGAAYGLMMLVHAFTCVFGMASCAALCWVLWVFRAPRGSQRNMALILLAGCVVLGAYWLFMSRAIDARVRVESLAMVGLLRSHRFYWITLVHLLVAGFGYAQLKRETDLRRQAAWWLLIATQIAAFLCRNIQVLTGFYIQPFHFISLGSHMGCLFLFLALAQSLTHKSWWTKIRAAGLSVTMLLWALHNQKTAAEKQYLMFGIPRDMENGVKWVRERAPKDANVLSLSIETAEILALYTQANGLATPIGLNIAGPFTDEQLFYKTAQLLKTFRADPDLFLAERFPLTDPKAAVTSRVIEGEILRQEVDRQAFEPVEWFAAFHYPGVSDAPILTARRRIRFLYDEVPSMEGPFYLWINDKDRRLLRMPPSEFGGRLVYENASVRIYEFK